MSKEHKYIICGLVVQSELALPEFSQAQPETGEPQVRVKLEKLPNHHKDQKEVFYSHELTPDSHYLYFEDAGGYLISNGNEIIIDPLSGSNELNVRLYLLGSAFGILLHQRNLLPLHASVVKVGEQCVAFIGDSGAGKSTLVASLNKAGFEVMGDDICPVDVVSEKQAVTWSSFPRIKLWSDVLEELGYDQLSLVKDSVQDNKYHYPLGTESSRESYPLTRIYELSDEVDEKQCHIEEVKGKMAMQALLENVYRSELLTTERHRQRIFEQCALLANKVKLFHLNRCKEFDVMEKVLQELQAHWQRAGMVAPDSTEDQVMRET